MKSCYPFDLHINIREYYICGIKYIKISRFMNPITSAINVSTLGIISLSIIISILSFILFIFYLHLLFLFVSVYIIFSFRKIIISSIIDISYIPTIHKTVQNMPVIIHRANTRFMCLSDSSIPFKCLLVITSRISSIALFIFILIHSLRYYLSLSVAQRKV